MSAFLAAVRFLTILPAPGFRGRTDEDLARSVPYFPIVGLLIGALAAACDYALGFAFPVSVRSAVTVILLIVISGGLHLDGLADTADGFFSGRQPERVLEIMRDSRTGPMGVGAVVCVVGLKAVALACLPAPVRWKAILLAPTAGRCAAVLMMAVLLYARSDGGMGSLFGVDRRVHGVISACVVLGAVGWFGMGFAGITAAAASVMVSLAFSAYSRRRIGGFTGDTLGAVSEIVELVPLLTAAAWVSN
jgi:adenosylcobinamide-GDP ribazoletransferase